MRILKHVMVGAIVVAFGLWMPPSAAVSNVILAQGPTAHAIEACASAGMHQVTIDLTTGSGTIAGASACIFQPDAYVLDRCAGAPDGQITCAYSRVCDTGTINSSLLVLAADGTLSYRYVFCDGTVETVTGVLLRV